MAVVRCESLLVSVALGCLMAMCSAVDAGEADGPERLIQGASVILRVNDPLWCDRQVAAYAATSGTDPALLRSMVADLLFHSRSLEGFDLHRPALMAIRGDTGGLLAVIPIADRRLFMSQFGEGIHFNAPLVKIGELDGTTVLSQNTSTGLVEYRLLVQDETAYLARTAAECRLLASKPLVRIGEGAPLSITVGPRALVAGLAGMDLAFDPARFQIAPTLALLLRRFSGDQLPVLADQVAEAQIDLKSGPDGNLVIEGRLQAKADSSLARLIAVQKNISSRLLPLIRTERSVFTCYGGIAWQGMLDQLGQDLAAGVAKKMGPAWNAHVEESWRRTWSLRDRNGVFAFAVDLTPLSPGDVEVVTTGLTEHPQSADVLVYARRLVEAAGGLDRDPLFQSLGLTCGPVEDVTVAGLPGFRQTATMTDGKARDYLVVPTGRHVVSVESNRGRSVEHSQTTIPRVLLDGGQKPEGTAAVLAAIWDHAAWARAWSGAELATIPEGRIAMWAKSSSQGDLSLSLEIPIMAIAVIERELASAMKTPPR